MALTDHKATISDLVFSHDDSKLYTSSLDGTVYSWNTFGSSRTGEYIEKGVPCIKLAVSSGLSAGPKFIVASFNAEYNKSTPLVTEAILWRKQEESHGNETHDFVGNFFCASREYFHVTNGFFYFAARKFFFHKSQQ